MSTAAAPRQAPRDGKLVGTRLENWRRVSGGWAAEIVGEPGDWTGDKYLALAPTIASAYNMKTSMVTILPDPDDECRATVLAQRASPITGIQAWAGPESIDLDAGQAPVVTYADGQPGMYEIYRPGWGTPHVAAFGTSGSGKSEFLSLLFTLDRWTYRLLPDGTRTGMVADFLVDPQQGQSFAPFLDDLAGPVATSLEEAKMLVGALHGEMLRRNRYLAREAKWWDEKRRQWRTGRKWWDPRVDGPILALTIDEAHAYLADREFAALVTAAGRMWRKCGGQLRLGTHTPLLADLGGSMALRDMLTGGFVWVGRVANSLSGATAFNGRLPVDPRSIPHVPGLAFVLSGLEPKAMLARTMWEPDWYDWLRNADDEPIGYPAVLPEETLAAFGPDYKAWVRQVQAGQDWTPPQQREPEPEPEPGAGNCANAVVACLAASDGPLDMDGLDAALRRAGRPYRVRTVREALTTLRKMVPPLVETTADRRHALTPSGREAAAVRVGETAAV